MASHFTQVKTQRLPLMSKVPAVPLRISDANSKISVFPLWVLATLASLLSPQSAKDCLSQDLFFPHIFIWLTSYFTQVSVQMLLPQRHLSSPSPPRAFPITYMS